MAEVARRYQDNHERIKNNIDNAREYFKPNNIRFDRFRNFVFNTAISDDDEKKLKKTGKPILEFNIMEAYLSRQRGEFATQEPSLYVRAADGAEDVDPEIIELVDGYLRAMLIDANNDSFEYEVYTDLLSGGFSVIKVFTEYANPMSFHQNIRIRRAFNPTLCGFDPLARKSHKADGRFCYELYPKSREELEQRYGKKVTDKMKFTRNNQGYNWSYQNDSEDIALVADYYEKKPKKVKVLNVVGQGSMTEKAYEKMIEEWDRIEQVPAVIGKPKMAMIDTICRYQIVEDKTLDYLETDYGHLPHIFVDGNSILLSGSNGSAQQMTRPYLYHAEGIQRLKNFAGQTLANHLENLVGHKFMAPIESIPDGHMDAWIDQQKPSTLLYHAYMQDSTGNQLPTPSPIPQIPAPPEVMNTFQMSDEITQAIIGSYDAALGINKNDLSGIAIENGATQSNATAMPYIVGFMSGLSQAAVAIVDLMPKYLITKRTVPVIGKDGKRDYKKINSDDGIKVKFESNALDVHVEAGVNFAVQKNRDLQIIANWMKISPQFAEFVNEECLEDILKNFDIKGIDGMRQKAEKHIEKKEERAKNQPPPPEMLKLQLQAKQLELETTKAANDFQLKSTALAIDKQNADTNRLKAQAEAGIKTDALTMQHFKYEAEETRASADLLIKEADVRHSHALDIIRHDQEDRRIDSKESKNI